VPSRHKDHLAVREGEAADTPLASRPIETPWWPAHYGVDGQGDPLTIDGTRQIEGIGAAPGLAEGRARVVLREGQFDEVRPGDILVCQVANPAWFVLPTKIIGLVTDAYGTASTLAVLGRRIGIPAVVGTSVATREIRSGDWIRINGTTGLVKILQTAG
jgi:pyruvate,water dikinase